MDRSHLPTLLRRLSDAYRELDKYDDAAAILDDIAATSSDDLELCAVNERLLELSFDTEDHGAALHAARGLAATAHRAGDPRCTLIADRRLGDTAWSWQAQHIGDDEMWGLALAVVTTPERKAVELRDRAYLLWELAVRAHTATAWFTTAAAFDAAFVATQDPRLSAGADLARSNARH